MRLNEFIQIGSTIRNLRKNKGYSQKEMANKLGIAPSTYSGYETNYREPTIEMLDKIASILEVTIKDMILYGLDNK